MKYTLVADIGGTNPRIAMLDDNNTILKKQNIEHTNIINQINDFLKQCGENNLTTDTLCIAAAGPIKDNKCKLTNANLIIDPEEIKQNTLLKHIFLINDFEALGYAINSNTPKDTIKPGTSKEGPKIVVGIGTGLGCSLIINNEIIPTEIGFLELNNKHSKLTNYHIEELLSGNGLEKLYQLKYKKKIPAKEAIKDNEIRKEFTKIFAQLLKNLFFVYLPTGGIYLAGGVLQKNKNILNKSFIEEFQKHFDKDIKQLLSKTPIYLLEDYDISLYGCGNYIKKHHKV